VKRATEALVREAQNKTKSNLESQADVVDTVGNSITVSSGSRLVSGMAQVRTYIHLLVWQCLV